MFFRHHFIGRVFFVLLILGLLLAAGPGLFRSGYQQGFVSGMAFTAENGEPAPESAAIPGAYGDWRPGGMTLFSGGPLWTMFCFSAIAFLLLMTLLFGAFGHRILRRHGHHAHHWGRHHWSGGPIDPEKEPDADKRYV
jgi:hypothetical protein